MREARIRVAAEWREPDLAAVDAADRAGRLSLDGLITHRRTPPMRTTPIARHSTIPLPENDSRLEVLPMNAPTMTASLARGSSDRAGSCAIPGR